VAEAVRRLAAGHGLPGPAGERHRGGGSRGLRRNNAIGHLDAWIAGDEDGTPYLEQHLSRTAPQFSTPLFVTGDPEWSEGTQARLAVRQPIDKTLRVAEWRELASAPFTYDTKSYYKVVLWDQERVWIYYRAHVSWPRWVDAPAR
jgi:hypothetical protein